MRPAVFVALVMAVLCSRETALATEFIPTHLNVYEIEGAQLVAPGAAVATHLVRSRSFELEELIAESFPGARPKLLTFPTFALAPEIPVTINAGSTGRFTMIFDEAAIPFVTLDAEIRGVTYEPVTAWLSSRGGSVFLLYGGAGSTYVICLEVFSGPEQRTEGSP